MKEMEFLSINWNKTATNIMLIALILCLLLTSNIFSFIKLNSIGKELVTVKKKLIYIEKVNFLTEKTEKDAENVEITTKSTDSLENLLSKQKIYYTNLLKKNYKVIYRDTLTSEQYRKMVISKSHAENEMQRMKNLFSKENPYRRYDGTLNFDLFKETFLDTKYLGMIRSNGECDGCSSVYTNVHITVTAHQALYGDFNSDTLK